MSGPSSSSTSSENVIIILRLSSSYPILTARPWLRRRSSLWYVMLVALLLLLLLLVSDTTTTRIESKTIRPVFSSSSSCTATTTTIPTTLASRRCGGGGGSLTPSSSSFRMVPNVSSLSSSSGETPVVAVVTKEEEEEAGVVPEIPRIFTATTTATSVAKDDDDDTDANATTSTPRRDETVGTDRHNHNNNDVHNTITATTTDKTTTTTTATTTTVRTIQRLWYTCAIISGFGEVSCLKSYGCFINMVTGSSVRFLLAVTSAATTVESWHRALRLPLAVTVGYALGIAGGRILWWWHQTTKVEDQPSSSSREERPELELSFWQSIRHHVHHFHHWASSPQKLRQRQNPSARLLWSGIPYILLLFSAPDIVPDVLQFCWRRPVVTIPTSLLVAGQSMGYGLVTQLLADVPSTTTPPLLPPVNVNVLTGHLTTLTKAWIDQFLRNDDNNHTSTTTTTTQKQKRSLYQRFQSSIVFTGAAQQSIRVVTCFGLGTILASILYQRVPGLLHRQAIITGLAYTLTLTWYAVRLGGTTTSTTTTTNRPTK